MTQEEKAKAYDEAFNAAKEWYNNPNSSNIGKSYLYAVFPDLKESKDEKMWKLIKKYAHYNISDMALEADHITREQLESWLEKQGEQKPIINVPPREVILAIWDLGNEWKELTGGSISTKYGTQLDYIQKHWQESEYYLREKQGEQKSTDKVEPKFKVGDWVISTLPGIKYPHLITDIQDGYYIFGEDDDHAHIASNDDVFKLWTIADAKDGDVLANDNEIVIFKENNFNQKDLSGCMFVHCSLCSKKGYWYTIGGINPSNYVPATIEQHDLLFSKMKEAGYEWDAENLQLTKILHVKELSDGINIDKQKLAEWSEENEEYNGEDYGIDGLWHAMNILEKTLGKVNGYQTDDGFLSHQCAITAVKKLYKQKTSEWTEEDEEMFKSLKTLLDDASCYSCTEGVDKILAWLKQKIGR